MTKEKWISLMEILCPEPPDISEQKKLNSCPKKVAKLKQAEQTSTQKG